jgi:hypothetical protein
MSGFETTLIEKAACSIAGDGDRCPRVSGREASSSPARADHRFCARPKTATPDLARDVWHLHPVQLAG